MERKCQGWLVDNNCVVQSNEWRTHQPVKPPDIPKHSAELRGNPQAPPSGNRVILSVAVRFLIFPATLFSHSPSVPRDKPERKAKNSDRGNHKPAEAKETTDSASG